MDLKDKIRGGLWGGAVGDALGVPHEFKMRDEMEEKPVSGMDGFDVHNQPAGTWSDDTSLTLCTLISLNEYGLDFSKMMSLFLKWLEEGYCTPHGKVFDIGDSTMEAILTFGRGEDAEHCGGNQTWQNGNGSLMRMLPLSLYIRGRTCTEIIDLSSRCSNLTHGHIRSQLTCSFYSILVKHLLGSKSLRESFDLAVSALQEVIPEEERHEFSRILDSSIFKGERISSTGYVIHSLEASLFCLDSTSDFRSAVLKAVNLGFDTDTTAAITGSIAGLIYGYDAIPQEWLSALARKDFLAECIEEFINKAG